MEIAKITVILVVCLAVGAQDFYRQYSVGLPTNDLVSLPACGAIMLGIGVLGTQLTDLVLNRRKIPDGKCPLESSIEFDDHCYEFLGIETTNPDAQVICSKLGGNLVSIETEKENEFLYEKSIELFNSTEEKVWTSGTDAFDFGYCRSNLKDFDFTFFEDPAPAQADGEMCMFMDLTAKWDFGDCFENYTFICEYDRD